MADRLERLSSRTASLLNKLGVAGADVTTTETLLETANRRIREARFLAEDTYKSTIERAESSNGTVSDLRKIESQVINPGKDLVSSALEQAKDALSDVLTALPK